MKTFSVFTGFRDIKISLPDKNYLYYAIHENHTPSISQDALISYALDHPYGSEPLSQIGKDSKVIIIVDDTTRPTPCKQIIPHILERVEKRTKNITFVTAPGTHRPLNEQELDAKIGKEYIEKYGVVNVNYKEVENYDYIGDTEMGTPLYIHKVVLNAEYKMGQSFFSWD